MITAVKSLGGTLGEGWLYRGFHYSRLCYIHDDISTVGEAVRTVQRARSLLFKESLL